MSKIEGSDGVVTFSADGKYFGAAVANRDSTAIQVAPVADGPTPGQTFRIEHPIFALALSPDGKFLAASHEGHPDVEVTIINLTNGMRTSLSGGGAFSALALSAGATVVAMPYLDNTVRAKGVPSGAEYSKITHQQLATTVALTSDGKYVASGSEDGTARVMETESGRPIALVAAGSPVVSVAFTAETNLVLISADNTIRSVNFLNRPAFQALSVPGVFGLSPRGGYFSVFDNEKSELSIVDRVTGNKALSVLAPTDSVTADLVRYSSDDQYLAIPEAGKGTTVYELKNPTPHYKKAPGIIEQTISGAGKLIAWSTAHDIQFSALANDSDDRIRSMLEFSNAYVLQLSPDGKLLAAAGKDPALRVFNVATKEKIYEIPFRSRVRKAIFSPEGRYLLTSSDNKDLILSTAETGKEVWLVDNADSTQIVFSDDGKLLGTAGGGERGSSFDVTVKETVTQRQLLHISREALPVGMSFSRDGSFVDIIDNTSLTRYYMATQDLIEQTCQLLTRESQREGMDFVHGRERLSSNLF